VNSNSPKNGFVNTNPPNLLCLKPLPPEVYVNNVWKFNSYFTENTARLHYKYQLVSSVYGNNRYLFENGTKLINTACGTTAEFYNVKAVARYSNHCTLNGWVMFAKKQIRAFLRIYSIPQSAWYLWIRPLLNREAGVLISPIIPPLQDKTRPRSKCLGQASVWYVCSPSCRDNADASNRILPVVLYGCETWSLTWREEHRLRAKSIIFWDVTPCSLLSCNRRFGGTYRLHLQGLLATCLLAVSCWNYLFDPEDGGDMFLRNVGCNLRDYTASHPRRWYSS
jgi:hypothetical protein